MYRLRLVTVLFAAFALLLAIRAQPIAAAAPTNTFPGGAAVIDNAAHPIPAGASLWYRFDYAGDRSTITLTLVNGSNSGLAANIFTPSQIGDWWETPPVGRGTAQALNCDTGEPETSGGCQADDLTWVGNTNESGTYYVQVVNNTSGDLTLTLTIQGSGVTLAAPPSASSRGGAGAPAPSAGPAAPAHPVAPVANTDPGHAAVIDNQTHMLAANSSAWYRFNYAGDRSEITLTLPNGAIGGLGFNVYTPAQVGDWWDETPIGRGTAQMQNCDTGEPETNGGCQSNDLNWVGNFNLAGTYLVQVTNSNSTPSGAQLQIQGDGVTLGQ